jgi:hypothetical protein
MSKPTAATKPASTPDDKQARKDAKRNHDNIPLAFEHQLYFDTRDSGYLAPLNGRFVVMKKNDLTMRMRALGLSDDVPIFTETQGSIRQTDYPFYAAQNERMIDFAGPVAGRRVGMFEVAGKKFLVTEEAQGVWAPLVKDEPEFFPEFLAELLPGEQFEHVAYWLALALKSMRAGDMAPGQACFFAGAPKCGKSLLQSCITEILGGRACNPFKYLMGENFNKDLCGAEHWMVEDPGNSTDIRTRRLFGEKIKEATVNRDLRINGKGKDAGLMQIFRRVTISINNEAEALAVCPPMVEGVKDKINLFRCANVEKAFNPFRDKSGKVDRAKLWAKFMGELHAVRSWLLTAFGRVPKHLSEDRMGVRCFHHPEILSELSAMTYESRFFELLEEMLFDGDGPHADHEAKASDFLKDMLVHNRFEAEKVIRSPGQCGAHFGKLLHTHPHRISKRIKDGTTLWTVKPPVKNEQPTP